MAKKRKRKSYVYRRPSAEFMKRNLAILRWPEVLYQAYKKETVKLCDYLRSDLPLDERKRGELADLIERRIQHQSRRGRKPGTIPSPHEITQGDVIYYARKVLQAIRAENGGKVPRGGLQEALKLVCDDLAYVGYNVEINEDQVLAALRRGQPRSRGQPRLRS
jgi:hypothetical protein